MNNYSVIKELNDKNTILINSYSHNWNHSTFQIITSLFYLTVFWVLHLFRHLNPCRKFVSALSPATKTQLNWNDLYSIKSFKNKLPKLWVIRIQKSTEISKYQVLVLLKAKKQRFCQNFREEIKKPQGIQPKMKMSQP